MNRQYKKFQQTQNERDGMVVYPIISKYNLDETSSDYPDL